MQTWIGISYGAIQINMTEEYIRQWDRLCFVTTRAIEVLASANRLEQSEAQVLLGRVNEWRTQIIPQNGEEVHICPDCAEQIREVHILSI